MNIEQAKHIINTILPSMGSADTEVVAYIEGVSVESLIEAMQKDNQCMSAHFSKGKALIAEAKAMYNPLDDANVGDGLTFGYGTDRNAYTIVSRSEKVIEAVEDSATLLNRDELVFHRGGFSAHCSNQYDQKYSYERDPNGRKMTFRRRKNGKWLPSGLTMKEIGAKPGRHKFYDFNF